METKKMTTCPQRGERIRMIRVGRKGHIRKLCPQDVEEFFHENGIGVLLGGRLGRVSPRRNCAPPDYPTRWSDRIVQSDHG